VTLYFSKAALCAATTLALAVPAHAAVVIGGSDLLTLTHAAQMETWLTGDPQLAYSGPLAFTNIFDKASGDTSADFHAAVDGKGPTFFVMEATAAGGVTQIIGGYKPISWTLSGNYITNPTVADRIAFIFNLISTTTLQQTAGALGDSQSYNNPAHGPTMGEGHDIYVDSTLSAGHVYAASYCLNPAGGCTGGTDVIGGDGGGGQTAVTYGALEVFTISADVPIPAAAPLLLGALGLTGWIARRRKG
jgi:hypothetical protein